MSLLIRPNEVCPARVNLVAKERNFDGYKFGGRYSQNLCAEDGFVIIRNGEHVAGNMGKSTLGDGSKTGLFYVLLRDHGKDEAARCMNRLAKLTANYLGNRGFSIGIDDVTPGTSLMQHKQRKVSEGYDMADKYIDDYEKGRVELKPGCNSMQSLESMVTGVLNDVRKKMGEMAVQELPWANAPRIMATCGSKGSNLNISQMIACLGQQNVDGKRIQDGFVNRTLPHFSVNNNLIPAAKGFVANSFYSGLTATEFFFHTMGGREGLVDTAVKTAQTGYMARRLMKVGLANE